MCQPLHFYTGHDLSSESGYNVSHAGIAVWWEFGTIAEGMNIVLEDVPEPMTLKLKTAGHLVCLPCC